MANNVYLKPVKWLDLRAFPFKKNIADVQQCWATLGVETQWQDERQREICVVR